MSPFDEEAEVALEVCLDMTNVDVVQKSTGKKIGKGVLTHRFVLMKRVDDSLKIFYDYSENVSKCPFSP